MVNLKKIGMPVEDTYRLCMCSSKIKTQGQSLDHVTTISIFFNRKNTKKNIS